MLPSARCSTSLHVAFETFDRSATSVNVASRGVASLLALGGYLLLAAAWEAFVVDLWTALAGGRSIRRRLEETPSG
ncbi:hypothetical protein A6E15_06070 [Natrinema saccharevitans]|uniref:Uncharacterized protein n=1 Tax=Natrinema saccharevitans TaxID=301967 RepID=A0A1S8AV72_9EURY|nr:hypothetical protein A6E15_06070 [Natrinema saccharevitans]